MSPHPDTGFSPSSEEDEPLRDHSTLARYAVAVGCVLAAFGIHCGLASLLNGRAAFILFVPPALIAGWYGGVKPGVFALSAGLFLGNFFYLAPGQKFWPVNRQDAALMLIYVTTAGIGLAAINNLHLTRHWAERIRRQAGGWKSEAAERQRVGEILRASEARLRELADAMPQIVWTALPDGKIEYVNRKWFEYSGLSEEETYVRDGWKGMIHPEDADRALEAMHRALQTGGPFQIETRIKERNNGYRWHLSRAVAVRDEAGNVTRWFATSTDIEDQKRAEQDLEIAREQIARHAQDLESRVAERTAKLEETVGSLEGVLYHVAHDLRAPLRSLAGFSRLLIETQGVRLDEEGKDSAERIIAAAVRMDQLIQDLLAYGRLGHAPVYLQPVDLEKLVESVLAQMRKRIEAGKAEVRMVRPLPVVQADPSVLKDALSRILGNALTFVAPNVEPRICMRGESREPAVRLWVEDNGIGIEPEHWEKIFHVFERLHPAGEYEGTGIGLAIVAKGMERMSGRAGVESKPGEGSRFWVELPAAARAEGSPV